MPALNAPGIDAAPPDSVSRPCTGPGAGCHREGIADGLLGRCGLAVLETRFAAAPGDLLSLDELKAKVDAGR